MFARKVTARVKANSLAEFAHLIECEVLPWLRKQKGFQDLIILAVPDGSEVTTISFWDHEGNAQAYNSSGYPEVLKTLAELLDGTPYVKTFDVVSSTVQSLTCTALSDTEAAVRESRLSSTAETSRFFS